MKTHCSIIFRLQNVAWQDEALRQGSSSLPLSERNRAKNRFPQLMSGLFAYPYYIGFQLISF